MTNLRIARRHPALPASTPEESSSGPSSRPISRRWLITHDPTFVDPPRSKAAVVPYQSLSRRTNELVETLHRLGAVVEPVHEPEAGSSSVRVVVPLSPTLVLRLTAEDFRTREEGVRWASTRLTLGEYRAVQGIQGSTLITVGSNDPGRIRAQREFMVVNWQPRSRNVPRDSIQGQCIEAIAACFEELEKEHGVEPYPSIGEQRSPAQQLRAYAFPPVDLLEDGKA